MRQILVLMSSGVFLATLFAACAMPAQQSGVEPASEPVVSAPAPSVSPVAAPEPAPTPTPAPSVTPIAAATPAPAAEPAKSKDGLAFGGNLFLALQNWSKVGMASDSKMGVGLGGSLGIGFQLGDMKVIVGPEMWSNTWSANYSSKAQSATDRVYFTMNDAGVTLFTFFDDMFLQMSTGSSTMKAGMVVSGKEIAYSFDGVSSSYKSFGIGFKSGIMLFGLGIKNYDGVANDADHVNFMLGIGF